MIENGWYLFVKLHFITYIQILVVTLKTIIVIDNRNKNIA